MSYREFSGYTKELFDILTHVEVTRDSRERIPLENGVDEAISEILAKKRDGKKIIILGNGGSAAIASHLQNDLCKSVTVRSLVFNETPLLSALSNDIGYAEAFEILVELWAENGDILIAISSSGKSENIIRATTAAQRKSCWIITLSGFKNDNPLRSMGKLNFYVPKEDYGVVELGHSILTHYFSDLAKDRLIQTESKNLNK